MHLMTSNHSSDTTLTTYKHGDRHLDQFNHFCTAQPCVQITVLSSLTAANGFVRPWPSLLHGTCGRLALRPPKVSPQMASRLVQPFWHSSPQRLPLLFNGQDNPQNCPFSWGISSPSNKWLTNVTNRQTHKHTDRLASKPRYSVCCNSSHLMHWVHSMWPKNQKYRSSAVLLKPV